jgi:hypothetical protein
VNSSEQVPSDEWVALEHMWEEIAEAWFKPEGEGSTFMFRVPRDRFQTAEARERLTIEDLLEAASISIDEVESWRLGDDSHSTVDGTNPELRHPLPPPPPDATHLTVYVHLKPPAHAAVGNEGGEQEMPLKQLQALEACWRTILGLETSIDTLRLNMESLRVELEAAFRKSLTVEEKCHALQADVVQWTKAKSRVHYALPKVREFVHRATWASAVPERKRLEELVTEYIEPRIALPQMDEVRDQLNHLQKDRQVLFAQGNSVYQEGRALLADIQRALSTLQRNAADRARQKRSAGREKGKHL